MQLSSIFLYALIIIYVVYKQLQPKRINSSQKKLLMLVLFGCYFTLQAVDEHHLTLTAMTVMGLFGSLVVLAVGFGAWRAMTCKVWQENGTYYRQASWFTLLLWVLMILLHGTIDYLTKIGSATMFLYLALTLFTQHYVLALRMKKA